MAVMLEVPVGTPAYAALRDRLRQAIIAGEIPGGTRLTTAELAARYGVSQMPVREALQALQGEGLITLSPHRGASVIAIDAQFVRNVYDIRGAIEVLLARLSLPKVTEAVLAELELNQREFVFVVEKRDADAITRVNRSFHRSLYKHADNPMAIGILDRYTGLMWALRRQYGLDVRHLQSVITDHEAILEALRLRDEDMLASVVRMHAMHARDDVLSRMG